MSSWNVANLRDFTPIFLFPKGLGKSLRMVCLDVNFWLITFQNRVQPFCSEKKGEKDLLVLI